MSAQAKLSVGSVASQTTYKFQRNVINSFLMHSFLVSCQIAFRCRIINACNLSRFEVTRKTWVFSMCVANVDCQMLFGSEYFVTEIARRFNLLNSWTVGCPYIPKIGFELMPAKTACLNITISPQKNFRHITSYLTECTTVLCWSPC